MVIIIYLFDEIRTYINEMVIKFVMARNLRHCARALAIVRAALVRKNANALLMLCFARF